MGAVLAAKLADGAVGREKVGHLRVAAHLQSLQVGLGVLGGQQQHIAGERAAWRRAGRCDGLAQRGFHGPQQPGQTGLLHHVQCAGGLV